MNKFEKFYESIMSESGYMAAAADGDESLCQAMVDKAAKKAGFAVDEPVFRGDSKPHVILAAAGQEDWSSGDGVVHGGNLGFGLYFSPSESYAGKFGKVRRFYLRGKIIDIQKPEILSYYRKIFEDGLEESGDGYRDQDEAVKITLEEFNADGVRGKGVGGFSVGAEEICVPEGSFAKLADAITRDDSGKIIPLSKRFDLSKDDIRF